MSLDLVIHLSNVRLSFPHLAEPQTKKNEQTGEERKSYSADFILQPTDPAWNKFHEIVNRMAVEKWKEKAPAALQFIQQNRKSRCYGWGQEKVKTSTFQVYDGYEGMYFITAGRDRMPQIIDAQGNPVSPDNVMACKELARRMYAGCYVNAAIKPWLQENKHGLGVRCDLVAVQFFRDGDPFGEGNIDASALFGAAPQAAAPAPGAAPPWGAQPPAGAPAPAWAPPAVPGMPVAPFQAPQQAGMAMPAPPFPGAPASVPGFLR